MSISGKSFSIWLVTSITGTILYALIPLGESDLRADSPDIMIILFIFGLVFSIPAIPFTYLNLLFIRSMRTERSIRYLYTVFSVLLFICIAALLIVTLINGEIPRENELDIFQLLWAHTLTAVITTLWFAKDIIEGTNSSHPNQESNSKNQENVIHRL